MKRSIRLLIIGIMILVAVFAVGCSSDIKKTSPDPVAQPGTVYIKVTNTSDIVLTMDKVAGQTQSYSISINLVTGDRVSIYDSANNTYANYSDADFDGTAKRDGVYTFLLRIDGATNPVSVTAPQGEQNTPSNPNNPNNPSNPSNPNNPSNPSNPNTPSNPNNPTTPTTPTTPETPDTPTPGGNTEPENTTTTVYYTNSERWSNVYAYVWNYATGRAKATWPGERLTSSGTSGFGETQYALTVDYSQYDRVIFNNGAGDQTKDLAIGKAADGYYGKDGIFTMGTKDYGKVEYFTVKDTKNLNYLSGSSKKISVYTPRGYTSSKRYGVLYMFDSQNLYIGATGAEPSHDSNGSWAVDVAVNNLVKKGNDGVIIVAIDNTDGHRDQELTMSLAFGTLTSLGAPQYGDFRNGKLDNLGDFMKETLMPWVRDRYSVDTSREKTGIAGSSSGGLAAYYLGLRDNDLYGYIGAFSPANGLFTTADWNRFYASKNNFAAGKPKIYVYCGKNDDDLEDMLLPETQRIKNLTSYGFAASDIIENYVDGGTHRENYWRVAFVDFAGKLIK